MPGRPVRASWSGPLLALGWLTVAPVPSPGVVDRRVAGSAIRWAPLPGLLLGGLGAVTLAGLTRLGAPGAVIGPLVVGVLAGATRGMHWDGLADTADGLGCYGPPERALAVMRDGGIGPFAVVTLLITLGLQAGALGELARVPRGPASVALAVLAGRCGFAWCCRAGVPAARPDGLGALVARTQHPLASALVWPALAAVSVPLVPERPWQGPVALALAAGLVVALSAHTTRRFGGVTGDVLGAAAELSATVVLVVLACGRG